MFGHDDMNSQQGDQGGMPLPAPDGTLTHNPAGPAATSTPPAPHQDPSLPADTGSDDQADTGAPAVDDAADTSAGDYMMDDAPAAATDPNPAPSVQSSAPAPSMGDAGDVSSDDLLDIKQGALQQLAPLLGHLDQTPEEQFRTTMMMIQASDNQALLKNAYDAAQAIEDEKTRAQALLDVVNEINYFTQQGADGGQVDSGQEAM